jgi:hypothetical protein
MSPSSVATACTSATAMHSLTASTCFRTRPRAGRSPPPRAVLFDLEPGVIGAVALSRRSAGSSARVTSRNKTQARAKTEPRPTTQKLGTNSAESPCCVAAFVVNSEPRTGARLSVCLCVGPKLARCVHRFPSYQPHTHSRTMGRAPVWSS